jgi:hypothetical protein
VFTLLLVVGFPLRFRVCGLGIPQIPKANSMTIFPFSSSTEKRSTDLQISQS